MKIRLALPAFLALMWFLIPAQTVNAQFSAGAGLAFGEKIERMGLMADLHYRLPGQPMLRIGAGFTWFFPEDVGNTTINYNELNLNLNFIFFEEFMFRSYALAGLNYFTSGISGGGMSVSDSEVGINLGLGAEYDFGNLPAFAELKYTAAGIEQFNFGIGMRYRF